MRLPKSNLKYEKIYFTIIIGTHEQGQPALEEPPLGAWVVV